MKTPHDILRRPIITESATLQMNKHNKYVFEVDVRASKTEIRDAFIQMAKDIFNKEVRVTSVNTINVRGKPRRGRNATRGRSPKWKKALVTLKSGDTIELY